MKAPGLNKRKSSGIFKEGPGKYKCSSCGNLRNRIYPLGLNQYCTKCFKDEKYKNDIKK